MKAYIIHLQGDIPSKTNIQMISISSRNYNQYHLLLIIIINFLMSVPVLVLSVVPVVSLANNLSTPSSGLSTLNNKPSLNSVALYLFIKKSFANSLAICGGLSVLIKQEQVIQEAFLGQLDIFMRHTGSANEINYRKRLNLHQILSLIYFILKQEFAVHFLLVM